MRDGNITLGQLSRTDLPRSEPYDPYTARIFDGAPPTTSKPPEFAPTRDSDDAMDIVPRTQEELEALRPKVAAMPPGEANPRSYGGG